jgi:hypothetical protein
MARIDSPYQLPGDAPLLKNPWVLAGGAALLWVVYARFSSRKKDLTSDVVATQAISGQVIDPITTVILDQYAREAFKRALPKAGQQYADVMARIATESGASPFILAAIMERETGYGAAGVCKGKGPYCLGTAADDFGLMQINKSAHPDFFKKFDSNGTPYWAIPVESVRYGAKVLMDNRRFFASGGGETYTVSAKNAARFGVVPGKYPDPRPLSGAELWQAAVAAYNTGAGNVIQALAAGRSADATTTGKDYGADTLRRATRIAKETARQLGEV